jgi:biopolymer transport protein ExbB
VFEIIKAGGVVMWPIILCSIIAMAIIGERFWSLQRKSVAPKGLVTQVWRWIQEGKLDKQRLDALRHNSPLGKVLAAALTNMHKEREMMKLGIEEVANHVIHDLQRYLNTLGIIGEIAPLLGLLGTVTGIIRMFAAMGEVGLGNPMVLSSGLSEALITTAAGLCVAIPAVIMHRYFQGVVDELVIEMEEEAFHLLDVLDHDNEVDRE